MPPHVNIETLLEYYKILGIDPLINDADFRAAYKAKILEHHPDKREDGNDEMFKCVQKAYEALKDISNRKHYDSMILLHRANTGWRTPKLSSRVSTAKRTQSATNVKVRMTQPTRPMGTNTPRPTTQRTPNKTSPRPTEPIHRTSSARPPGRKPQATTNHRPVESCDPHFPKHYSIITPLNHVLEDGTQCTFDISSEALGGALRNGDIVMDGNGTSGIIVGAGFDGIYWCETGTGHASFFGNFKNPSFTFRKIGHLKGSAGAARARCDHLAKKQREDLEKFKSKQQKKNEEVLLKRKQELHMLQQLQSLEALEEKHRRDMWARTEAYWSEVFQKLQAEGENVHGYSAHTTSTKFNADNTPLSARQTGKDSSSSSSTSNSSMNKGAGAATPIRSVPLTFSRGATNDPRTSRGSTNVTPRTPIRSSQYGRVKQESSGVRTTEASSFTSHFQRINTHRTPTKASTPNTKYYPSSQNKPRPAECTPGTFRATNSANHATLNPQRKAVTPTFRRVASARPASGKEGTYEARMRGACPPVRNPHTPSCPVTADLGRSNTMGQRETAPLPVPQRSSIVSQKSRNLARHSNQAANPAPLISPRTLFTPRGPAPCPISKIISPDHLNKLNQDSETHISSRRTNLMGADAGDIVPRRPIPAPTTTADLQRTSPKEPLNKVEVYGENIPPLNFLHSAPTSSGGSPSTTPRKKESNSIIHDTNQNTTNPLEQLSLNRGLSTILTNGPRLCTDTFVIHPPKYRSPALRSPGEHSDSSAMYSPAMGEKYHSKTSRAKQSDIDRF